MIDAILPAGGRISGEYAADTGERIKALLPVDGRTVLERTIDSLRGTGRIGRIVVIGPDDIAERHAADSADALLPETETGPGNIVRGLEWLYEANGRRHSERALIVTTDLPFLTPEAITGFLDACSEADICVPVLRRCEIIARFGGRRQPYVPLRDGWWTIGCVFLVNPESLARNREHLERVFARRKSALSMLRMLGPGMLMRFFTWRLRIPDIERYCQEMLGCSCAAIHGCAPELAFDVDSLEEYRWALECLASREKEHR